MVCVLIDHRSPGKCFSNLIKREWGRQLMNAKFSLDLAKSSEDITSMNSAGFFSNHHLYTNGIAGDGCVIILDSTEFELAGKRSQIVLLSIPVRVQRANRENCEIVVQR